MMFLAAAPSTISPWASTAAWEPSTPKILTMLGSISPKRKDAVNKFKQKRLEARRDSLAAVRERAESAVADISGDRREALTRELLDDAAREFDGGSIEVYGRDDDADLIESILDDYEEFSHAGSVECLGGIVAENEASRVRVNNTFDSMFDAVWDEELKAVSDRLFDQ